MSKKAGKKVLDYDPLAWLKDEDQATDEQPVEPAVEAAPADVEATEDTSEAVESAAATSTVEETPVDESGFGFFADDEPEPPAQAEAVPAEEESAGFGFFTDEPESADTKPAEPIGDDVHVFELGTELSIKNVADLKAQIEPIVASHEEIGFDASELQKIDAAGLQLLYSLKQVLAKREQNIRWVQSNAIINQAAEIIGMEELADEAEQSGFGFFDTAPQEDSTEGGSEDGYGFF